MIFLQKHTEDFHPEILQNMGKLKINLYVNIYCLHSTNA